VAEGGLFCHPVRGEERGLGCIQQGFSSWEPFSAINPRIEKGKKKEKTREEDPFFGEEGKRLWI